jgi:hypothetical protein
VHWLRKKTISIPVVDVLELSPGRRSILSRLFGVSDVFMQYRYDDRPAQLLLQHISNAGDLDRCLTTLRPDLKLVARKW